MSIYSCAACLLSLVVNPNPTLDDAPHLKATLCTADGLLDTRKKIQDYYDKIAAHATSTSILRSGFKINWGGVGIGAAAGPRKMFPDAVFVPPTAEACKAAQAGEANDLRKLVSLENGDDHPVAAVYVLESGDDGRDSKVGIYVVSIPQKEARFEEHTQTSLKLATNRVCMLKSTYPFLFRPLMSTR